MKYTLNKGMAFSIFSSFGLAYQNALIYLTGIVLLVFCISQIWQARRGINVLPGILVGAGGLGNLLSRIFYGGVVDFLEITFFRGESSVFNIADIYIGLGLVFILIRTIYYEQA